MVPDSDYEYTPLPAGLWIRGFRLQPGHPWHALQLYIVSISKMLLTRMMRYPMFGVLQKVIGTAVAGRFRGKSTV